MVIAPRSVATIQLPAAVANLVKREANHNSLPLGLAFIVGILWLASDALLRKRMKKVFGCTLDDDGVPRYRNATGFSTQLVFLPCLFLLSFASNGFSFNQWSRTAGEELFTEDGSRFYDWAFCYVFAAYMLTDVALLQHLSLLLRLHHVGCLVGLAIGFAGLPSGFPLFAAGVISLELGSAALNLSCLYPHRYFRLFTVVMTVSNSVAVCCCALWLGCAERLTTQVFVVGLLSIFITFRQKTVFDEIGKHRAAVPCTPLRPKKVDQRSESPRSPMFLKFSMQSTRDHGITG